MATKPPLRKRESPLAPEVREKLIAASKDYFDRSLDNQLKALAKAAKAKTKTLRPGIVGTIQKLEEFLEIQLATINEQWGSHSPQTFDRNFKKDAEGIQKEIADLKRQLAQLDEPITPADLDVIKRRLKTKNISDVEKNKILDEFESRLQRAETLDDNSTSKLYELTPKILKLGQNYQATQSKQTIADSPPKQTQSPVQPKVETPAKQEKAIRSHTTGTC